MGVTEEWPNFYLLALSPPTQCFPQPTCWEQQLLHIKPLYLMDRHSTASSWSAAPPGHCTFYRILEIPLNGIFSILLHTTTWSPSPHSFSIIVSHFHLFHYHCHLPTTGLQRISFWIFPDLILSPDSTSIMYMSLYL